MRGLLAPGVSAVGDALPVRSTSIRLALEREPVSIAPLTSMYRSSYLTKCIVSATIHASVKSDKSCVSHPPPMSEWLPANQTCLTVWPLARPSSL